VLTINQKLCIICINKMIGRRIGRIASWLFIAVVIITAGVLIALALMFPLSGQYTKNHQLSYVCQASAGTIALLASLFSTRNQVITNLLSLAIELYLFGIAFQLFALVL